MDVTVQHFEGCPPLANDGGRVRVLADEPGLRIRYQMVTSPEDAVNRRRFDQLDADGVPADVPLGRTPICGLSLAVAQGLGAAGTGLLRHLRVSNPGTKAINLIIEKIRRLAHR